MPPAKLDRIKHLPYMHHILIDIQFSKQLGDTYLKGADCGLKVELSDIRQGEQEGALAKLAPCAKHCHVQTAVETFQRQPSEAAL